MATEIHVLSLNKEIAATMASAQHYAVALNSSNQWAVCTAQGQRAMGIMQENPATGNASAMVYGVSKAVIGASVDEGDPLTVDSSSRVIKANDRDEYVLGIALSSSSTAGDTITMLITHSGSISEISGSAQQTYTAAANYATTGQYLAVKAHTTDGEAIKCSTAGEEAIGILQNAPASGAECEIATHGECTAEAGASITAGDALAVASDAQIVPASGNAFVIGYAIADIASGETGTILLAPQGLYSVDGSDLADGKVWVGNGSGDATAVTPSGDATWSNAGVITVTDVTVGSDATGDILYKSSATALARLGKGTAADLLQQNAGATAPQWSTMSGDATIAAGGAITVTDVTVGSDATGDILYKSSATALARLGKGTTADLLQQGSSNAPQWATASGDATIADGGAITVTDVTVGSDATGDILYKSSATALARLAKGTALDILQQNAGATAPQWATVSGDATIADGGALTVTDVTVGSDAAGDILYKSSATALARLGKGTYGQILAMNSGATAPEWIDQTVQKTTVEISAANVKTLDATPVVLVDFSALVSSGLAASGDALVFHGAILNVYGGSDSYDQNENTTIVYQTAGGGATVSLTLANFFNAAADGALTTLKPIATDVAPEADEDLVLSSSASPYNAQGDRNCYVEVYFSVFTPHA